MTRSGPSPVQLVIPGRTIAYRPALGAALRDVTAALVLQQFLYWMPKATKEHEGEKWVYKTYDELGQELGLSPHQARRAVKRLTEAGLLRAIRNPVWGADQTRWYRPDYAALRALIPDGVAEPPDGQADSSDALALAPAESTTASAQYQEITYRDDPQKTTSPAVPGSLGSSDENDALELLRLYVRAMAKRGIGKVEFIEADIKKPAWQAAFLSGVQRHGADAIEEAVIHLLDYLDEPTSVIDTRDWRRLLRGKDSASTFISSVSELRRLAPSPPPVWDKW